MTSTHTLVRGMITVSLVAMVSIAQANSTCTELNKCGWCELNVLIEGQDNVSLSLMFANPYSLKESGYLAKQDFPTWVGAAPGHPLQSSLPLWLRVEKVSDSTVILDERLAELVSTFGPRTPFNRTVESLDPSTRYTAFAYAKYEGGATQGYTHKKPFVKICFTTYSDGNSCSEESVRRRYYNDSTGSWTTLCDAPDTD